MQVTIAPRTRTAWLVVIIGAFLAGCASTAPVAPEEYRKSLENLKLSETEAAAFVLVQGERDTIGLRTCSGQAAVQAYINGEEVSTLKAGDMAFVRLVPGTHQVAFANEYLDLEIGDEFQVGEGEIAYFLADCQFHCCPAKTTMDIKKLRSQKGRALKESSDLLLSRQRKITTQK